jgi:hypothetical protein
MDQDDCRQQVRTQIRNAQFARYRGGCAIHVTLQYLGSLERDGWDWQKLDSGYALRFNLKTGLYSGRGGDGHQ